GRRLHEVTEPPAVVGEDRREIPVALASLGSRVADADRRARRVHRELARDVERRTHARDVGVVRLWRVDARRIRELTLHEAPPDARAEIPDRRAPDSPGAGARSPGLA